MYLFSSFGIVSESSAAPVPPVFTTDASIRLLESACEHATSKYLTQIYAMCFMGRIVELACDRATNFVVQRLLASMGDPSEVSRNFMFCIVCTHTLSHGFCV